MKSKKYDFIINKGLIIAVIIFIIIAVFVFYSFVIHKDQPIQYRIVLEGDKYITINEGEEYVEPGFIAYANEEIVTSEVQLINEVKNIPGVYKVLYKINDYTDYRIVEVKKLIDYNLDIMLEVNHTELTNDDIIINVTVTGETFYSLILPDEEVIYSNNTNFIVKENGTYIFKAINDKEESFTKEIDITNIDKVAPNGTCKATLTNTNTIINVDSLENNIKYSYYDSDNLLTTNNNGNYTINHKTTDKISVILEDEATNKNKITCQIIDNRYYEQVKPNESDTITYHKETDTLKTYIVNRGKYYLTYIWVKDAYTQLNKFDSPEYGINLYKPSELLSKANSKYNLNDKLIIGFNASGFYLKNVYDANSVKKYPPYDRTSVGTLVITDGKVVRNAYDHADKTWYMVGVNKDNKLLVFEDTASNDFDAKKQWSNGVISSGIRNTFTFAAPVIQNGQRTNIHTSMPLSNDGYVALQLICQINENNFLLFTSAKSTRNTAIDEFLRLGCKTAMNLDGGGSIALLYKDKNSNEIKKIIGNGRGLSEVGYFTE